MQVEHNVAYLLQTLQNWSYGLNTACTKLLTTLKIAYHGQGDKSEEEEKVEEEELFANKWVVFCFYLLGNVICTS